MNEKLRVFVEPRGVRFSLGNQTFMLADTAYETYAPLRQELLADHLRKALSSFNLAASVSMGLELDALRRDAARYNALKTRHSYTIVTRLIGSDGYNSTRKNAQIDDYADASIKSVDLLKAELAAVGEAMKKPQA